MSDADQLSLSCLQKIEAVCARFESEHHSQISIEPFLVGVIGPTRKALLQELLALDFELCQSDGILVQMGRYQSLDEPADAELVAAWWKNLSIESRSGSTIRSITGRADTKCDENQTLREIGPYRILRSLGAGGMGQVFLAEQSEPVQRRVALKVINIDAPSGEILARFQAERQALAMMDHNNIAKVFDAGMTIEGLPYFVMELVEGDQITRFGESDGIDLRSKLQVFVQVCRAVQHAHQKGIMHRDLKPANVLVMPNDGRPEAKVIDFGLVKAVQPQLRLGDQTIKTSLGQIVGTLAYMSPEQATLDESQVDARSDIYSLGVILYEMLTGSTPIRSERIQSEVFDRILHAIREEETVRPSQRLRELRRADSTLSKASASGQSGTHSRFRQRLEEELDWIVLRALEKSPERRYETAAALADDVERFLEGDPVLARPPSPSYRLKKAFFKYTKWFVAAATVVVLLVLGLVGTGSMWLRAVIAESDANQRSEIATLEASNARTAEAEQRRLSKEMKTQRDNAVAAEELATRREARSNFHVAMARWESGRVREAREFLWKVPAEHRNLEWRLADHLFHGSMHTSWGHYGRVSGLFVTDQKELISIGQDWSIRRCSTDDYRKGRTRVFSDSMSDSTGVHPSGDKVATVVRGGKFVLRSLNSDKDDRILAENGNPFCHSRFNASGTLLASVDTRGNISLWDGDSGKLVRRWQGHKIAVQESYLPEAYVVFSPDGDKLATSFQDGHVRVWETSTGDLIQEFKTGYRSAAGLAFGPLGRRLATTCLRYMKSQVILLELGKKEPLWSRDVPFDSDSAAIAYSPAGDRIIAGGVNGIVYEIDATDGTETHQYKGHERTVSALAYDRDGFQFFSAARNGTVKAWRTDHRQMVRSFYSYGGTVAELRYSPDSKWLASASFRWVQLWDTSDSSMKMHRIETQFSSIERVGFSQDSKYLFAIGIHDETRESQLFVWQTADRRLIGKTSVFTSQERLTDACFCGGKLAIADSSGRIQVASQDVGQQADEEEIELTEFSPAEKKCRILDLDFHAESGRLLAADSQERLRVWNLGTKKLLTEIRVSTRGLESASLSPDGERILMSDSDNYVRVFDVSTGEQLSFFAGHTSWVAEARFSSNGDRIVSVDRDGQLKIWDVKSREELLSLPIPPDARTVDLKPSSQQIAYADPVNGDVYTLDIPAESVTTNLRGKTDRVFRTCFSEDGSQILAQLKRKDSYEALAWDIDTYQPVEPKVPASWHRRPTNSEDGRLELLANGTNVLVVNRTMLDRQLALTRANATPSARGVLFRKLGYAAQKRENWYAAAFYRLQDNRARGMPERFVREAMEPLLPRLSNEELLRLDIPESWMSENDVEPNNSTPSSSEQRVN